MHAHDELPLVPVQTGAEMRDEMLEDGHGSRLGGARALGTLSDALLAMFLCDASGWPQGLKREQMRAKVHENGTGVVVDAGLVHVLNDVGHDHDDA